MPSTLLSQTFNGTPSGMNQALPGNDIGDDQAQYIQDALLDYPALTRRRGPVQKISSIAQPTRPVHGIATTLDPQGNARYMLINGTAANGYFTAYSANLSALTDVNVLPFGLPSAPPSSPYPMVVANPGINGGAFIGVSTTHDYGASQALGYWMGGISASYNVGSVTFAGQSKSVTGTGTAWTTYVTPGMWLFANTSGGLTNTLIGCVYSVNSDTSITLVDPCPYNGTTETYNTQAVRGVYPRVTTGRITCSTTGATVNGGQTKFIKQALNTGTWNIYRQQDWAYVGQVSSVQSDISLTLTGNANTAMADDAFVAIRGDGDWGLNVVTGASKPGWLSGTYGQRQWFMNTADSHEDTYRLVYSDVFDAEAYDLSFDGTTDFVNSETVVQESARGMAAAYNALLLFKENETFALTGGDPTTYEINKISDDGVLGTGSIQQYGGGVIWAGRDGIHFYDGVQVSNLTTATLGNVWMESIVSFNPAEYRMGSMIARNHYFLYIENLVPTVVPTKGVTPETPSSWVIVINLTTMALTMATNLGVRSSIVLPATSGYKVWYVVNDATKGYVCTTDDLFDTEAADSITCQNCVAGPDFFYESKKYDGGDPLRLKRYKLLMLNYLAANGDLVVDNVPGLNEFGIPQTQQFPATVFNWNTLAQNFSSWNLLKAAFPSWAAVIGSVFLPNRVKFGMDSQFYSFRVYQSTSAMTRLKIGPFSIGYKVLRTGRV